MSSRVIRLYGRRPLLARAGFTKSSSTVTARRRISENGCPAIYTRRAYDWTLRFRTIADALAALPADDLILDGEALVADSRGVPDLGLLHADLAAGCKDRLLYYAFDLLYFDGFDLRGPGLPSASACSQSCWRTPPSASSLPSTWRERAPRSKSAPAPWV